MLKKYIKKLDNVGELYLRIKVNTKAHKDCLKDIMSDETLKINIAAVPVKGKANQALISFLAKEFFISKNNVKIINGITNNIKLIKIIK